jgi:hypothetical protein
LDSDRGGLFTLEEISLLSTVLVKAESVLLERNLNSCRRKLIKYGRTYFDEKMDIEVGAPRVFLVGVLYSSSFDEINSL